ncbi:hypothetical protein BC936DRAFT_144706 [Jimgerdemannia flammicorona]|uniref:Uncharacterized protein n=2 Tax=Jimgerdemannia flammicorona TaxID=994334 RepID=A0A433DBV7_9FUNG|nr:hypothetical protein BC936DRAFT_144706 [Jimgerdemannia flammicorona]RUS32040.1 hypothetical protein BC938DRAFT_476435 [Jimgerdemannia flammicorona]
MTSEMKDLGDIVHGESPIPSAGISINIKVCALNDIDNVMQKYSTYGSNEICEAYEFMKPSLYRDAGPVTDL